MNVYTSIAVIVAGGKGQRMGATTKKQYLALEGIPVLARTLQRFDLFEKIDAIILVLPESDLAYCRKHILEPYTYSTPIFAVNGGRTRMESVLQGLQKADRIKCSSQTLVWIHDGVRPFVNHQLFEKCMACARDHGACIPVVPLTDTIKKTGSKGQILSTVDRETLFCAQTPQVFHISRILSAFDHAAKTGFEGTDDSSVMEHAGFEVQTVSGSPMNIKLTTPEDLALAKVYLEQSAL